MMTSKTKTSFYRRLFVAYLIDCGINTIPKIQAEVTIPRRTLQDTICALGEIDISCQFIGAPKNGHYVIESWGAIDKSWIKENIDRLRLVLNYR
nr:helix-turn-helix domain-containing protein [Vibrio campbellii]